MRFVGEKSHAWEVIEELVGLEWHPAHLIVEAIEKVVILEEVEKEFNAVRSFTGFLGFKLLNFFLKFNILSFLPST